MVILSLLLAHLIADFWLIKDSVVRNKSKKLKKYMLPHILTSGFALAFIWGYIYKFSDVVTHFILPLVFIFLTHFLIDLLKVKLLNSIKSKDNHSLKKLGFFLLDHVLHIGKIIAVCILFFDLQPTKISSGLVELLGENQGLSILGVGNTLLFMTIIFILATSVSGQVVKLLLGSLPSELTNFEGEFSFKNSITESIS